MKGLHVLGCAAVLALFAGCSTQNTGTTALPEHEASAMVSAPAAGSSSSAAPRPMIVGLKPGASSRDIAALSQGLSNAPAHVYQHALLGFAGSLSQAEISRLKADPRVAFVEADLVAHTCAQTLGWGVNRIDAELNSGSGGAGVTVAVLDTGIDLTHPDLAGAIIGSYNATGSGSANDGNGHGSHVAGIIGARNNSTGYVGVAPNCSLLAVKVLNNQGSGQISWIVAGIDWCTANKNTFNIKVANMSLGASGNSSAMATAITNATNAGITFVVAAGNSFADANNFIPAKYSNVICVSALNSNNTFASYSNWGTAVDLIAPGTNVPSLWRRGGYKTISGTSMASPHVAGAAALWLDDHSGGFADVLAALQAAGESGSWPGDPDGISEKLVDAQSL
ncbi:S8 family serine peptidase [bacterium]|nr:S8 family serine peptidase [bacterium]